MRSPKLALALVVIALPAAADEAKIQYTADRIREESVKHTCHAVGYDIGVYVACGLNGDERAKTLRCYREIQLQMRQAVEQRAEDQTDHPLARVSNGTFLAMADEAVLLADIWLRENASQIEEWLKRLRELRGLEADKFHRMIFAETTLKGERDCMRALAPPSLDSPLTTWGTRPEGRF